VLEAAAQATVRAIQPAARRGSCFRTACDAQTRTISRRPPPDASFPPQGGIGRRPWLHHDHPETGNTFV